MSGLGKGQEGNPKYAANCARESREAKPGTFHGGKPPSGPKPEPVRVNGIRAPKDRGLSK
jgi:hypothetical protein